jgi:hypothetical protein
MSLSNILELMNKNRPLAETVVTMENPNTYKARVGVKRAATEALKQLRTQYSKELIGSTVFIVVTGAARDKFTEIASSEAFGCFVTDPESLYQELTSKITPSLFGRENARNLFNIAGTLLREKAFDLGIQSYPRLSFNDKYNAAVNKAEDFTPLLRNAINEQVGSEIVGINAIHSIVDTAINKNHSAAFTPIVLSTSDEKFALDLHKNLKRREVSKGNWTGLTDKVFLVVAGKASKTLASTGDFVKIKEVSEETATKAMDEIRDKL